MEPHEINIWNRLLQVQVVIIPYLPVLIDPLLPCVWRWVFWGHVPWLSCGNKPSCSYKSFLMNYRGKKAILFLNWLGLLGGQSRLLCNLTLVFLWYRLSSLKAINRYECWMRAVSHIATVPSRHDWTSFCSAWMQVVSSLTVQKTEVKTSFYKWRSCSDKSCFLWMYDYTGFIANLYTVPLTSPVSSREE